MLFRSSLHCYQADKRSEGHFCSSYRHLAHYPKRALAPPPRLRAKPASFCALCADRQSHASTGSTGQKRRFKNCANLCTFLHFKCWPFIVRQSSIVYIIDNEQVVPQTSCTYQLLQCPLNNLNVRWISLYLLLFYAQ